MIPTNSLDYLNYQQTFDRLFEYLDRALSECEEARVRDHLDACVSCLRHFEFEVDLLDRIREKARTVVAPERLREGISKLLGAL